MKNKMKLILIVFSLCSWATYAVEREVFLYINEKPVTNLDIVEHISTKYYSEAIRDASSIAYYLERELPFILFDYYAEKKGITITEQEVTDAVKKIAAKSNKSIDEFLQGNKPLADKTIEKSQKRLFKSTRDYELSKKVIRYYDPNVDTLTEADIQAYIDDYRKFCSPPTIGHREAIQVRSILIRPESLAKDDSLRNELDKIKGRLNKGEKFEDVAKGYSDKTEFVVGEDPQWQQTKEFEKTGIDALVPWVALKGKAVIVQFKTAVGSPSILMQVTDYMPNTRKEVGDALNDKYLRQEVLEQAKGFKFGKTRKKLIDELKNKIKYVYDEETTLKKISDTYNELQND